MGIQGFFKHFFGESEKLGEANKFIKISQQDDTVNRIYIDFPSIIYTLIDDFPEELNNTTAGVQDRLLEKINQRIDAIVDLYPHATIYIYLEAIPTVAKMVEQHYRRLYRKIIGDVKDDLKTKLKLTIPEEFDFSILKLDSPFNERLVSSLTTHLESKSRVVNFNIFNPAENNIGEAEHRIINHIANNLSAENNNFVIYSPDADVFILSTILTNNLNTELRRVNVNTLRISDKIVDPIDNSVSRQYFLINSNKFMDYIISKITTPKDRKRLIVDIIFAFNILGDDFIPLFKNFKIANINLMYEGYSQLPTDVFILDYNDGTGHFTINKNNLIGFLSTDKMLSIDELQFFIPKINKDFREDAREDAREDVKKKEVRKFRVNYDKNNSYFTDNPYNKIVFDYLTTSIDKGLYYNQKQRGQFPNSLNFGFGFTYFNYGDSYDVSYTDPRIYNSEENERFFLNITDIEDKPEKNIELNINNYDYRDLTKLKNITQKPKYGQPPITPHVPTETETNELITNYLEGYQFILDLYLNLYGTVRNNFWYYKYHTTPSIRQIIDFLTTHDIPNYTDESITTTYFNVQEYGNYLQTLVQNNYDSAVRLINNSIGGRQRIKVGYNELISFSSNPVHSYNIVFNCKGKPYLNKCIVEGEHIEPPLRFLYSKRNRLYTPPSTMQPIGIPPPPLPRGPRGPPQLPRGPRGPPQQRGPPSGPQGFKGGSINQNEEEYKEKYLKYKQKYLELKNKLANK
jgi:hypothetical protein